MTIRLLENGNFLLAQSGCIRMLQQTARVTEDWKVRAKEDMKTRVCQDALARSRVLQPNCGNDNNPFPCNNRLLENKRIRLFETKRHCRLSQCGLSLASYMVGSDMHVSVAFALCCGNYPVDTPTLHKCVPSWTSEIVAVNARWPWPSPGDILWSKGSCATELSKDCGVVEKLSFDLLLSTLHFTKGHQYELRVYVWDGQVCPSNVWPDAWIRAIFIAGG